MLESRTTPAWLMIFMNKSEVGRKSLLSLIRLFFCILADLEVRLTSFSFTSDRIIGCVTMPSNVKGLKTLK